MATDSALTSLLVMGASPLTNSSSGMPMGLEVSGCGFSIMATLRSPNPFPRSSAGFPEVSLSVGRPKSWPTVMVTSIP